MIGQTHGGKGDSDRPVDKKKWDECPLWGNIEKDKSGKETK